MKPLNNIKYTFKDKYNPLLFKPSRFKGKVPKPMALPKAVWINKPSPNESDSVIH
jgi:hypothetical protein